MITKDLRRYFPRINLDNIDDGWEALIAVTESVWGDIVDDIREFETIYDILMSPELVTGELSYMFNADIQATDTERQKKDKIKNATLYHKNRGLWTENVKLIIDNITGGDSQLLRSIDSGDWVIYGGESSEDPTKYWGTMGTDEVNTSEYIFPTNSDFLFSDGVLDINNDGTFGTDGLGDYGQDVMGSPAGASSGDPNLGLDIIGDGTEIEIPGNIYIDIGYGVDQEEIDKIIAEFERNLDFAYLVIYLGYVNEFGQFIEYQVY